MYVTCHHRYKIAGKHRNKISAFCITKRGQPRRWDVIKNHQQGRPHNEQGAENHGCKNNASKR